MTTQPVTLDKQKTAVLIMDFQTGIVKNATDPEATLKGARTVLDGARKAGVPVIYVQHRGGRFAQASPEADIHPRVAPASGDTVIVKVKAGSFSSTGLDVMLREKGIDTLVMMGVATSGCVLSTVRWANDINYKTVVVSDGCGDPDPEVHRVLTEKIFARQGKVITSRDFLKAVGQG